MYKKYLLLLFSILLIIIGIILLYKDYQKYDNKERIVVKIDNVDKQEYEYEVYDKYFPGGTRTKTAYYKHIYYTFNYDNVQLYDEDEVYSIFMKKGDEITIYYDKNTNSSEIYIIPFNKYVILITGIIYFIITIIVLIKKHNVSFLFSFPNAPWFVQTFALLLSYFCYRPHASVSYYMSYFFMIISLLITFNNLKQTINLSKQI